jgi:GntR family galactonate operon transcriptional repressor
MPATARAIEEGDAERNRPVMQQVLGFNRVKLSCRKAGAGRRNGRPGGSRSLGKK